ncbi:DUF6328 family protein [Gordonia terrae]
MTSPSDTDRTRSGAGDAEWNRAQRDETETQRLDRNWNSLLQELRVVQTGVQILTGFLLTLPFHDGFEELGGTLRVIYLITVSCAVGAAILLAAPVALHRALFRQHQLALIVTYAHYLSFAGLTLLGLALSGAVTVVFGATAGPVPSAIAGVVTLVVFSLSWLIVPLWLRAMTDSPAGSTDDPRR